MRQEDLAAAAGVSRPTIIGIESGTSVPQEGKLVRILAVLGVDVDGPRFGQQTELWLSMMGTLIEAIPEQRREPSVNAAIRELTAGIQGPNVGRADDASVTDELPVLTGEELRRRRFDLAALNQGDRTIDQPAADEDQGYETDDDDDEAASR